MLRAIELVGSGGTPIMGVDHGQLGYLTEVEPAEAADAVARFLAGERAVEERMLLADHRRSRRRQRSHRAGGAE